MFHKVKILPAVGFRLLAFSLEFPLSYKIKLGQKYLYVRYHPACTLCTGRVLYI